MKKFIVAIILMISTFSATAQVELKGVMGIYFLSIPSMQDYVNRSFAPSDDQLRSFVSSVMFAGEGGMFVSQNFETTLEFGYQIYSYTTSGDRGKYDLVYNNLMPSLLGYYVVSGAGYNFKFGGGAGLRIVSIDESIPASSSVNYSSVGYGFIGRIEGNTLLGGTVYANVGVDIRYDVNGVPESSNGATLVNHSLNENVNFNTLAIGVRLGITYMIGGLD